MASPHSWYRVERKTAAWEFDNYDDPTIYEKMDPVGRRDRLGRWSRTFHDALGRGVSLGIPKAES